jgi:ribosomal protein S1
MAQIYKPKSDDISFYVWMIDNWTVTGGLISQVTAARLLRKSKGRIKQMIDAGKLTEYRFENISFVPYPQVMKLARLHNYDQATQELNASFKELESQMPQEQLKEFSTGIMDLMKDLQNIVKDDESTGD